MHTHTLHEALTSSHSNGSDIFPLKVPVNHTYLEYYPINTLLLNCSQTLEENLREIVTQILRAWTGLFSSLACVSICKVKRRWMKLLTLLSAWHFCPLLFHVYLQLLLCNWAGASWACLCVWALPLDLYHEPSRARAVSLSVTAASAPEHKFWAPSASREGFPWSSCPSGILGLFLSGDTLVSDEIWGKMLHIKQVNKSMCCL